MFEGVREGAKKRRIGRCVLEERAVELAAATDIKAIDITEFYTVADVCKKLQCNEKTLKRRRDAGKPPWFLNLVGLRRAPAFLFWAWVADEVREQLGRP